MSIANPNVCPVCSKELSKKIWTDNRDTIHVVCDACGTYAMSAEFYEDHIQNSFDCAQVALCLRKHLNNQARPFFAEKPNRIPDGYQLCVSWRNNSNADASLQN